MPGTAWPVIGHPPGSSRSPRPGHGSDAVSFVTTRQQRFGITHLPGPHLTPPGAVSTSLTTTVFSQRSMWRFEATSRKATPKGQPSSRAQHRLLEASPTYASGPPFVVHGTRLGKVPDCLIHGLVLPRSGRTRVALRALRRSAAAMLRWPWRAGCRWRGCAGWPWRGGGAGAPVALVAGRPARRQWHGRGRRGRCGPERGGGWLPAPVNGRGGSRARPGPSRARLRPTRRSRAGTWRRPAWRRARRRARRPVDAVGRAGGGVGDLGEGAEQATVLVGRQRSGRSQPPGNRSNGGCGAGRHGGPEGSWAWIAT
jgi:hypothetical protein